MFFSFYLLQECLERHFDCKFVHTDDDYFIYRKLSDTNFAFAELLPTSDSDYQISIDYLTYICSRLHIDFDELLSYLENR